MALPTDCRRARGPGAGPLVLGAASAARTIGASRMGRVCAAHVSDATRAEFAAPAKHANNAGEHQVSGRSRGGRRTGRRPGPSGAPWSTVRDGRAGRRRDARSTATASGGGTAAVPVGRGSTTVMVRPPPGVCEARICPPCDRTIAATIDSPRPVPPFSRLREASTRKNRSNSRCSASSETPGPLSLTRDRRSRRARPARTRWRWCPPGCGCGRWPAGWRTAGAAAAGRPAPRPAP